MKIKFVLCALVMSGFITGHNIAKASEDIKEISDELAAAKQLELGWQNVTDFARMMTNPADVEKLFDEFVIDSLKLKSDAQEANQKAVDKPLSELMSYWDSMENSNPNGSKLTSQEMISLEHVGTKRKRDDESLSDSDSEDDAEEGIAGLRNYSVIHPTFTIDPEWMDNELDLYRNIQAHISFKDYLQEATEVQGCIKSYNSLTDRLIGLNDTSINYSECEQNMDFQKSSYRHKRMRGHENIKFARNRYISALMPKLKKNIDTYISNKTEELNDRTNQTNVEKMIEFNQGLAEVIYNPPYNLYSTHFQIANEFYAQASKKYIYLKQMINAQNGMHNANLGDQQ